MIRRKSNYWDYKKKDTYHPRLVIQGITAGLRVFFAKGYLLYLSRCKSTYNVYAVNQYGTMYKGTHSQVFRSTDNGTTYTLEEYTARFMEYYDGLMNAGVNAENALAVLNAAKEKLQNAVDVLAEKQEAAKEAEATLTKLQEDKLAQEDKVLEAEKAVSNAEDAKNAKLAEESEAIRVLEEANAAVESARADVDSAKAVIAEKKEIADAKMAEFQTAKENLDAASADVSTKQNIYNDLRGETGGSQVTIDVANQHLEDAKANQAVKDEAKVLANSNCLTAMRQNIQSKNALEAAKNTTAEKDVVLQTATAERTTIAEALRLDVLEKEALVEEKTLNLESAEAEVDALNQEILRLTKLLYGENGAPTETTGYYAELAALQEQLTDANAVLEAKRAELASAEDAARDAQDAYDEAVEAITPLREAQTAYNRAVTALEDASKAYADAQGTAEGLKLFVNDLQDVADIAIADNVFAQTITLANALLNPITHDSFAYLNDFVRVLKAAHAHKGEADQLYAKALENLGIAGEAYIEAQKNHTLTLAELAVAQQAYDAKEAAKKAEEEKKAAEEAAKKAEAEKAKNDQNLVSVGTNETVKKTDAVQTGDMAPIAAMAMTGMGGFATMFGMAMKKFRRKK